MVFKFLMPVRCDWQVSAEETVDWLPENTLSVPNLEELHSWSKEGKVIMKMNSFNAIYTFVKPKLDFKKKFSILLIFNSFRFLQNCEI